VVAAGMAESIVLEAADATMEVLKHDCKFYVWGLLSPPLFGTQFLRRTLFTVVEKSALPVTNRKRESSRHRTGPSSSSPASFQIIVRSS
jgi:hypothetical protein